MKLLQLWPNSVDVLKDAKWENLSLIFGSNDVWDLNFAFSCLEGESIIHADLWHIFSRIEGLCIMCPCSIGKLSFETTVSKSAFSMLRFGQ